MNLKKIVKSREVRNALVSSLRFLPDEPYLKLMFRLRMGKKLDLENPFTFNEKLQWLKLHDRKPIYITMVDKYEAKKYVADIIGEKYIIPTLGVWDHYDEIDFDALPDRFVLKCTHDSGGLVIVRNKSQLNHQHTKAKIEKSLKTNFYWVGREWPYRNVKPRIIAEQYMEDKTHDGGSNVLPVYKFFCFDGQPKLVQAIQNDKQPDETVDYYDLEWKRIKLKQNYPNSVTPMEKPQNLDEMIDMAIALASEKEGFIRVDFYSVNGISYFSEYTFFSDSGWKKFEPSSWDSDLGKMIKLR